ncbi:class I SAM-dependent RNA methyltransferase [Rubritepida flocculans]|uniref:class I SAM-dependent RNA methyltransferase n=1 Tax=Rubritepida flocculans TaxID=182403 RepID=UPI0003F7D10C|nr:class I SAM-dependent RNA methyltransferase [Rubritepida flocculans]
MRLVIARMGAAGDGVTEDGRFLPLALPGEVVEAEPEGERRLRLTRLFAPSPERVPPPCPHFGACGACSLQHWADAPYAAWKRGLLLEALARAGFAEAPVGPLARNPPGARRRADFALARGRDGVVEIGFHARGAADVVALHRCLVLAPPLVALLAPLAAALRGVQGLRRAGGALVNLLDSGPDLLLRTDGALTLQDRQRLAAFAEAEGIARIAWQGPKGPAETAVQLRPVRHRLAGVEIAPPPGAFLQASAEGEAAITAAVLAGLPEKLGPRARIADLYAGLGTLSLPLAARGVVRAFEGEAGAVAALAGAHPRVQAERRDLARQPLLPAELKGFAAVVLDPPFAGAAEQVAQIARSTVGRVIYVSCNPAALARDAGLLRRAGFAVRAATPVDQFLWSAHLESVVVFAR